MQISFEVFGDCVTKKTLNVVFYIHPPEKLIIFFKVKLLDKIL